MKIFQNNIQSVNTSNHLLNIAIQKHQPQVVALQEVWQPTDNFSIPGYTLASKWYRHENGSEKTVGGGVAIFCQGKAKIVDLIEYKVKDLEACWCDVMINGERVVIGSVYINVGKIKEIDILESVITKIMKNHKKLIICLDANSRSVQWDPSCIYKSGSSPSRKMGDRFEEISISHSLNILNNGQLTYYSGDNSSAVDITLSHGIEQFGQVKWYIIEDFLQTPHKGIIIEAGKKEKFKKTKVIDWKTFDWNQYRNETKIVLESLNEKWKNNTLTPVDQMAKEMQDSLQNLVSSIGKTKMVTKHTKPWINSEIKELIQDLKQLRVRTKKHKSPNNVTKFKEKLKILSEKLEEAHIQYINTECEKLNGMSDNQKWKAIS